MVAGQNVERPPRGFAALAWARDAIRADARGWGVGPPYAELLFLAPAVGAIAVAIAVAEREIFKFLVDEDALLEWAQVPGYFSAFVLGAALAVRARRQGRARVALGFAVFAAACLFVTGEELSWGQRIFGFGTPQDLEELNNQGEVTIHNIVQIRVLFKFFLIFLGAAGAVLPWLPVVRRSRWATFVPPLFTTSSFLLIFGYNAARLVFFPKGFFGWEESFIVGKYGEWPETCLAYVAAGYAWLVWRTGR